MTTCATLTTIGLGRLDATGRGVLTSEPQGQGEGIFSELSRRGTKCKPHKEVKTHSTVACMSVYADRERVAKDDAEVGTASCFVWAFAFMSEL